MGNLAFQDVDFLLTDIQRSTPNREFLGLQSVQEPTKAVQFIGWVGVVHKPMIGGWPLFRPDRKPNCEFQFVRSHFRPSGSGPMLYRFERVFTFPHY